MASQSPGGKTCSRLQHALQPRPERALRDTRATEHSRRRASRPAGSRCMPFQQWRRVRPPTRPFTDTSTKRSRQHVHAVHAHHPVSSYSRLAVSRRSPTYFQARKMRSAATATTSRDPVEADRKNSRGCTGGAQGGVVSGGGQCTGSPFDTAHARHVRTRAQQHARSHYASSSTSCTLQWPHHKRTTWPRPQPASGRQHGPQQQAHACSHNPTVCDARQPPPRQRGPSSRSQRAINHV